MVVVYGEKSANNNSFPGIKEPVVYKRALPVEVAREILKNGSNSMTINRLLIKSRFL